MTTIHRPEESVIPGQPPSAQEIQRKLSVAQRKANPILHVFFANIYFNVKDSLLTMSQGKTRATAAQNSGTDTEDESSVISPNEPASTAMGVSASQPLSAIAERTVSGAEESDEDEEDVAGGWRPAHAAIAGGNSTTDLHSGYLWKKGSGRRKTWKKRWFVLRPNHLACYKTSAEYKLIRLLDISDIHAATPVNLKRHPNACGIVTQARTFYFQAGTAADIEQWVVKINGAKEALLTSSVPGTPIVIPPSAPVTAAGSKTEPTLSSQKPATSISLAIPATSPTVVFTEPSSPLSTVASPSRSRAAQTSNTSSDSDDGGMSSSHIRSPLSPVREASGSKDKDNKDSGKPVLSGYLMKCGGRRKIWRKRWFILTPTKLMYMGSHMDTKPHRQIMLNQILDAMEYRPAPANHNHRHASPIRPHNEPGSSAIVSSGETSSTQKGLNQAQPSNVPALQTQAEPYLVSGVNYTFKVFTPKKTFLLCAPSEEEEVSWISAIRVLIARRTKEAENAALAADETKKPLNKPGASASKVVPNTPTPTAGAPKSSATAVTAA